MLEQLRSLTMLEQECYTIMGEAGANLCSPIVCWNRLCCSRGGDASVAKRCPSFISVLALTCLARISARAAQSRVDNDAKVEQVDDSGLWIVSLPWLSSLGSVAAH